MLTKVISNYLLISLLLVFTLFSGCESKTHPEKSWFHEDEFSQDATLHAKIHNAVILDISSPQQPDGSESHAVRYEYEESGEHLFCIDPDEKYITEMTLLDEGDNIKLTLKKDDGCTNVYLNAGRYSMQITHDAFKVPERGTVAFIKHPSDAATESAGDISSTTTNTFAETNPAYYAFEVSGGNYDGYYLGTKKEKLGNWWDFLGVISADNNSSFMEKRHLFALEDKDGKQVLKGYDWDSHYWQGDCTMYPTFCVESQDKSLFNSNMFFTSIEDGNSLELYMKPDANQMYTLWNEDIFVLGETSLYAAENSLFYSTSTTIEPTDPTLLMKVPNMRLYKDGSTYTLQDNEVAFSSECNLTGPTYVISGDISDSVIVSLSQIKAIKLGGNYATLSLFGEKDFNNLIKTIGMNDNCLKNPIDFDTVGSIKVFNAKKVLLSSHNCDYCNLAGANLSSLDLDNISLRYANLATTQFNNSILEKADMRYAKLYGANLNYANLSGSTMCGTFLNGNILSGGNPATLSGAYMKNVNLAYSNLNGANFIDTNFHSPVSLGCGDADCGFTTQCATAVHSTIEGTDFTNAYLAGVDFSDSDLYGTNFTDAVLIGAKFTNATITGGATSSRAYSKFYGTFIQGVDFSNAIVTNTDFTNAYTNFNENALMFFRLNTNHTKFAGWPTPDDKVCVMHGYTYDNPTIAPLTDSSCICPDGSTGGCGDSVSPIWSDPKVPMDQSYQEASYASDPVCGPPNFNW